jgi:hypothetical protein
MIISWDNLLDHIQGDKQNCVIEEKIGLVALAEIHVFFSVVFGKLLSLYMQSPK